MARFSIYSSSGKLKYTGYPKYVGAYLDVPYLEFATIESPYPINWERGDYVIYSRTGLKYRLYSTPLPKKQAASGKYGAAFVYSNVKFYSAVKDLEIAPFRDVVSNDNRIHFSTRQEVNTFEDVYGIATRIQENMNDIFPGTWEIRVVKTDDKDLLALISEKKEFSVSGSSCLDALMHIYETWKNVGWTHTYENGKDVITIGSTSLRNDSNTTSAYAYGKNSGLTSIKKMAANENEFATRLYVYGSERNIQTRYYNGLNIYNNESVDIRNLMLPTRVWGKTDSLPDARKAYIQASADLVQKYGLIPRPVYFDGNGNEEIYPSITGLTEGKVRDAMIDAGQSSSPLLPPDTEDRIDEVLARFFTDDEGSKQEIQANSTWRLWVRGVGFNIAEQGKLTEEGYATISMKNGSCAGREFKVLSSRVVNYSQELTIERTWDESLGMGFPNSIYPVEVGDQFVLLDIPMPDYYITLAEERLLEAGRKMLEDYTRVSAYYEPVIDPIVVANGNFVLREGMYMQIYDTDIVDTEDKNDYVLIDTITIEERGELPSYRVTLREQKRSARTFGTLEEMIEDTKRDTSEKINKQRQYTERRFRDAQEIIDMLQGAFSNFSEGISPITIQTMSMLVGDESLQFRFVQGIGNPALSDPDIRYSKENKVLVTTTGYIQHMTLGITETAPSHDVSEYKFWKTAISRITLEEASKPYFIYIKASKTDTSAEYIASPTAIQMEAVAGYYHFLAAILNSEVDGDRSLVFLNGFTEVLPSQITTPVIRDSEGKLVIDLEKAEITAKDGAKIYGDISFESLTDSEGNDYKDKILTVEGSLADVNESIGNLQDQIDGVVENYFLEGEPTTSTPPVTDWLNGVAEEDKSNVLLEHVGDTYTNISDTGETAGKSWRWCECTTLQDVTDYIEVTDYKGNKKKLHWHPIADTDALKALEMAKNAQETADGKSRTFIVQPTPPYDEGDLWVQGENGDILRCKSGIHKKKGESYFASDWEKATKYTNGSNTKNLLANSGEALVSQNERYKTFLLPIKVNSGDKFTFKAEEISRLLGTATNVRVHIDDGSINYIGDAQLINVGEGETVTNPTLTFTIKDGVANSKAFLSIYSASTYDASGKNSVRYSKISLVKGDAPMSVWEDYQGDNALENLLTVDEEYHGAYNAHYYYMETLPITMSKGDTFTVNIDSLALESGTTSSSFYRVTLYALDINSQDRASVVDIPMGKGGWGTLKVTSDITNQKVTFAIWKNDATGNATAKITRMSLVRGSTPLMTWKENPTKLKNKIAEWASDSMFSPTEISGLEVELKRIQEEYNDLNTQWGNFGEQGNGAFSSYNTAYTNYKSVLESVIKQYNSSTDKTKAISVPENFTTYLTTYYDRKQSLVSVINGYIKNEIDSKTKPNDWKYLKDAFGQVTEGEVFLANLMGVGEDNGDNDFTVNAFMNGSDKGKDDTYGKLMIATGIPATPSTSDLATRAKNATTRIYEKGKIITGDFEAKGNVKIGGAVKYSFIKIQDAFGNGTAKSSYMIGGSPSTYISFSGSEHSGMGTVELKFTFSPPDGTSIQIVSEPRLTKSEATLILSNVSFYLPTEPLVDGLTKVAKTISLNGGAIELVKLNNKWIVLSPITSNITIA